MAFEKINKFVILIYVQIRMLVPSRSKFRVIKSTRSFHEDHTLTKFKLHSHQIIIARSFRRIHSNTPLAILYKVTHLIYTLRS